MCDAKHKKGAIYNKVCYIKYKKPSNRKRKARGAPIEEELLPENPAMATNEPDEIDELSYLLYFKTCIVRQERDILKIKLSKTIEMREALIKKRETEFHKAFPFYFIDPSLVILFIK